MCSVCKLITFGLFADNKTIFCSGNGTKQLETIVCNELEKIII